MKDPIVRRFSWPFPSELFYEEISSLHKVHPRLASARRSVREKRTEMGAGDDEMTEKLLLKGCDDRNGDVEIKKGQGPENEVKIRSGPIYAETTSGIFYDLDEGDEILADIGKECVVFVEELTETLLYFRAANEFSTRK